MFRKRQPEVGAQPGTLVCGNDATPTRIQVMRYSTEGVEESRFDSLADLELSVGEGEYVWVDIAGIEQPELLAAVAERFGLSALTMEDIVNDPQRPKAELLDGMLFAITHLLGERSDGTHRIGQLSLVLGRSYLVTLHRESETLLEPIRERLRRSDSRLRNSGPDYLTYAVVDMVVDGYYPVLEAFGERLEQLEDESFQDPRPELLRSIHEVRTQLIRIRRSSWPMRNALESMVTADTPLIGDDTTRYFRDTLDHCVQVVDVVEMYRESAGALISTYLSSIAHRSNEIMKVLTMMSSVFVPLTFIAGIYGMNFEHMPELRHPWAYPMAGGLMLLTAAAMLVFFYRRGWLGTFSLRVKAPEQVVDEVAGFDPEEFTQTMVIEDHGVLRRAAGALRSVRAGRRGAA